ncbi:MAG: GGDEF domain-containing protein [Chromatiales bacterium]|nr:diguanylate cyclase [Gammaproteobacteria bacterium]MBW6476843.1 GGDEF domain-containing protein [Chromatiales bacterium]
MRTGRQLLSFLLPGALIGLALIAASLHPGAATLLASFSPYFPYAMVLVALLLGWRFDRSRLVFATVIIALGGGLLPYFGQRPDATARIVEDAVITLLPLNLALIALLKERGIFSWHGLLRWGFILAQPLGIALLIYQQQYYWLGIFDTPLLPIDALDQLDLRQPALLALLIALGISLYQAIRLQNPIEHGLFWSVLLCGYALIFVDAEALRLALLGGALLILIITVIELSYSMAYHDELTGLPGRRALNHALLKLGGRYTIAMLDVDHFKKFNDTYGHDIGDEVLKMVAIKMGKVSGGGKAFRYGGEEFSVVFPGKSLRDALPHLEQIREAIASAAFTVRSNQRPRQKPQQVKHRSSETVQITISIGAAERGEAARDPQAVIKAADKALYRAKKAGRNRVAA